MEEVMKARLERAKMWREYHGTIFPYSEFKSSIWAIWSKVCCHGSTLGSLLACIQAEPQLRHRQAQRAMKKTQDHQVIQCLVAEGENTSILWNILIRLFFFLVFCYGSCCDLLPLSIPSFVMDLAVICYPFQFHKQKKMSELFHGSLGFAVLLSNSGYQ